MIKFLKSLFGKSKKKKYAFSFRYKISMPMGNGVSRTTSIINVAIQANSNKEAIKELNDMVKLKVKAEIVSSCKRELFNQ